MPEPLSLDVEPDSATCRWELGLFWEKRHVSARVMMMLLQMIKKGRVRRVMVLVMASASGGASGGASKGSSGCRLAIFGMILCCSDNFQAFAVQQTSLGVALTQVLVGDHRQLRPVVKNRDAGNLGEGHLVLSVLARVSAAEEQSNYVKQVLSKTMTTLSVHFMIFYAC